VSQNTFRSGRSFQPDQTTSSGRKRSDRSLARLGLRLGAHHLSELDLEGCLGHPADTRCKRSQALAHKCEEQHQPSRKRCAPQNDLKYLGHCALQKQVTNIGEQGF
jgi:hypothetical protein